MGVAVVPAESAGLEAPSRLAQWLERCPNPVLFVVVLAGYGLGSRLAFWLTERSGLEAVFFVPAGITLGILLLVRLPRWPFVLGAAAVAEIGLDLDAGLSLAASVGFAAANTVEPVVGALLVRWLCGSRVDLARGVHLAGFVVGGVGIGPLVGATIGASVDSMTSSHDFTMTLTQWWLGDALGALIVGAVIVARVASPDRRGSGSMAGLLVAVGSVALTATVLVVTDLPLLFLVLVGVVVAGAQFGTRMVTVTGALIAVTVALVLAFTDTALLAGMSAATALVVIKLQLAVFTTAGLVVAAEAHERETAIADASRHREAEAGRRRLRDVLDSLFIYVVITDPEGVLTDVNETAYQATDQTPDKALGHRFWDLPQWSDDPAMADLLRREINAATATKSVRRFDITGTFNGLPVPLDFQIVPLLDGRGRVESLVMSSIDISERVRNEAEQARQLDEQRTIASRLQQSLLPASLPQVEGVEIAAVYHSAVEALEVGGDWYDAFETDDRLVLVIGDVVGRGLDAAGATGQLRMVTRALAESGYGPAAVVTGLDRFTTTIPAAFAATMLYVEYDPATGSGRFCRAGHIPPLLIQPGRQPQFSQHNGSPPLGAIPGVARDEGRFQLSRGGLLLLCTDGLIERRGETLDDGMDRLATATSRHTVGHENRDLTCCLEAVARELNDHGPSDDDFCIAALARSIGIQPRRP